MSKSKSDLSHKWLKHMNNSESEMCAQTAKKDELTEKPRHKSVARKKHQTELMSVLENISRWDSC